MNIVFDAGLELDDEYREAIAPILPIGQQPLKLDPATGKTDGTPNINEGFVFITKLPVDILKYHAEFFKNYNKAPQWFLLLINESGYGRSKLTGSALRYNLNNWVIMHADSAEALKREITKIAESTWIIKGKTLFLTKHNKDWVSDLADLLFGDDKDKYEIQTMIKNKKTETDAQNLLLCGEKAEDFKTNTLSDKMEPYFVFKFKNDLQHYINRSKIIAELAEYYSMTAERVESRLFFVDVEGEKWLSASNRPAFSEAAREEILLWDKFGLPLSHDEYAEEKIEDSLKKSHEYMELLKENILIS